jgi:hypothetical protein
MKKLGFILALGTIFVSSCKKDYTCTCTYITGGAAAGKEIIPNVTQQQAATICAGNAAYDPTSGSQTVKCSL